MKKSGVFQTLLLGGLALGLVACASGPSTKVDAQAVLRQAEKAMGGADLKTLRYAGSGSGATFGQAFEPGKAWPLITYSSYSRQLNYPGAALREDAARSRAEPTGGGAVPLLGMGEQRTSGWLQGGLAWNVVGSNTPAAPVALDGRIHDLWTSPHGVIKAALRNNAQVVSHESGGAGRTALAFTEPGRFTATAWINAQGLVERVESKLPHPVTGDTAVVTRYTDYRDHGGVKFPARIQQDMGGFAVLDLRVSEVQPHAPFDVEVPAAVRAATERVVSERVADGVWFLAGGSHNSVAIEMKDHLILVESPLYDGRALPVLAEAKKLVPNKPIRYVVNSHYHFDHSGGLRAAAAEGATVVTSEAARAYFEATLANPNSISPDALQRSGRKPQVTGVSGRRTFSDGARTVEVIQIEGSVHAHGFLMVWLPKERLLVEADAFTPGPPNTPPPATPNALHVNLVQNLERLKLNVDRILPLHGRVVPLADLYTAIGKKP